jgi:heme/copper-type cytochrome/quinol oxidase subunit 3
LIARLSGGPGDRHQPASHSAAAPVVLEPFWHALDIVWVRVFTLVYLMGDWH